MTVIVRTDPETFEWFQPQGEASEQQMSMALRIYAESVSCIQIIQEKQPDLTFLRWTGAEGLI